MAQTPTPSPSPTPDCSDETIECNVALEKADIVIQDQQKSIDVLWLALKASRDDVMTLQTDNRRLIDRDASLLRNPWFTGLLGVVAGIVIISSVHK